MATHRTESNHIHSVAASKPGRNVVPVASTRTLADGAGQAKPVGGNVQQAVGNIMAPYKAPPRRRKDNPEKLLCAEEGCNAFPMKEVEYCTGHARSKGLIENWKKAGREAE